MENADLFLPVSTHELPLQSASHLCPTCSLPSSLPPVLHPLPPKAGLACLLSLSLLPVPKLGRASAGLQGSALQWVGRTGRMAVGRRREGEVTLR